MVNRAKILDTLLYFHLFNYPLTAEEFYQFLEIKIKKNTFNVFLKTLKSKYGFYYLSIKDISKRLEREKTSKEKIKLAQKISYRLSLIPSINFIGISGSLAMHNANVNDDIDLFIITQAHLIWITRLISVLYLKTIGLYRGKKDKKVKNKICLNFFIDSNNLNFGNGRRNIYTAHEIVQMLPVFNRNKQYEKFIQSNIWIKDFLPNCLERIGRYEYKSKKTNKFAKFVFVLFNFFALENLAKLIQEKYMGDNITTEEIKKGFLAFHPKDYQKEVLLKLKK